MPGRLVPVRVLIVLAAVATVLAAGPPADAAHCAPGRSVGNLSPALRDYPDVPPFRVYGRAQPSEPIPVFAGVRDMGDDPAWYGEAYMSADGAVVHGMHRDTDTGLKAEAGPSGVYACAHGAGHTVDQRVGI